MEVNEFNSTISSFASIIGYIDIVINIDSYNKVKDKYIDIKNVLQKWCTTFINSMNYNHITYDESLKIHTMLDDIKEEILFDKAIGDEKIISDKILIMYEVLIKMINGERG